MMGLTAHTIVVVGWGWVTNLEDEVSHKIFRFSVVTVHIDCCCIRPARLRADDATSELPVVVAAAAAAAAPPRPSAAAARPPRCQRPLPLWPQHGRAGSSRNQRAVLGQRRGPAPREPGLPTAPHDLQQPTSPALCGCSLALWLFACSDHMMAWWWPHDQAKRREGREERGRARATAPTT